MEPAELVVSVPHCPCQCCMNASRLPLGDRQPRTCVPCLREAFSPAVAGTPASRPVAVRMPPVTTTSEAKALKTILGTVPKQSANVEVCLMQMCLGQNDLSQDVSLDDVGCLGSSVDPSSGWVSIRPCAILTVICCCLLLRIADCCCLPLCVAACCRPGLSPRLLGPLLGPLLRSSSLVKPAGQAISEPSEPFQDPVWQSLGLSWGVFDHQRNRLGMKSSCWGGKGSRTSGTTPPRSMRAIIP